MYEFFEHTADLGLRVRSTDLDDIFSDAGRGIFSMLVVNPQDVRAVQERTYSLSGQALDLLLFDWLSELLYTFETERLLFSSFDVRVNDLSLTATCRGETIDTDRHHMDHEVKAITYHGLKLERDDDGWLAEVIVDI